MPQNVGTKWEATRLPKVGSAPVKNVMVIGQSNAPDVAGRTLRTPEN